MNFCAKNVWFFFLFFLHENGITAAYGDKIVHQHRRRHCKDANIISLSNKEQTLLNINPFLIG